MRNLYILPFDHRASFAKLFGFEHGLLTKEQAAKLKDYKHLIYEGFLESLRLGIKKEEGAILVDEELGAEIHEEARASGIRRILTVEKSGQDEFDFEYGKDFREHINRIKPEYVKVLVRYNRGGDKDANERQIARLKILADFCATSGYGFLFELLAAPTAEQNKLGVGEYEKKMRGNVMLEGVKELRASGVEPDIWKLEGLADGKQFGLVVEAALRGAKKETGVIVLGRGEGEKLVRKWISVAAKIQGVVGLAVGRTVWQRPLLDFATEKLTREEASLQIAENYKNLVDLFESEK